MNMERATREDLPRILSLQKLAYVSEAKLHDDYSIPPLTQTLEDVEADFATSIILKLTGENGEIIGSVRAREENGRAYVGKLMVHPDCQNQGLGKRLLEAVEMLHPDKTHELFTDAHSVKNLYFYRKNGYKEFKRQILFADREFVFLEKSC